MYTAMTNLFIVPSGYRFSDNFELIKMLYLLEISLDHDVVIELIEQMEDDDPKETLIGVLEKLFDADWAFLNESIFDVTQTLIDLTYEHHKYKSEINTEMGSENLIMSRSKNTFYFFDCYPDTLIQSFVTKNLLSVPSDVDNTLAVVANHLFVGLPEKIAANACHCIYSTCHGKYSTC